MSTSLRFIQEMRATVAAQALANMVHSTVRVLRDSLEQGVDVKELVAGDVIKLSAGDIVPGDVRLLTSRDLFIS